MRERYKSVGMPESQFRTLSHAKTLYESDTNERVNWGKFLIVLAVGYLIAKGLAEQKKEGGDGER